MATSTEAKVRFRKWVIVRLQCVKGEMDLAINRNNFRKGRGFACNNLDARNEDDPERFSR